MCIARVDEANQVAAGNEFADSRAYRVRRNVAPIRLKKSLNPVNNAVKRRCFTPRLVKDYAANSVQRVIRPWPADVIGHRHSVTPMNAPKISAMMMSLLTKNPPSLRRFKVFNAVDVVTIYERAFIVK